MHYFSNLANCVLAEGQYYLLPSDCMHLLGFFLMTLKGLG